MKTELEPRMTENRIIITKNVSANDGKALPKNLVTVSSGTDSETEELRAINGYGKKTYTSDAAHAGSPTKHTSYTETMMHLIKGNLGCGILAMGDAYRNGGLITSTLFLIIFALISCYNQYKLVILSGKLKTSLKMNNAPGFSETIALAFENGPRGFKAFSKFVRKLVTLLMIVTQLGFCCVYFLFISKSLQQISASCGFHAEIHYLMILVWPVITATAMIRNLKYIAPLSAFANAVTACGICIILYDCIWNLPPLSSRNMIGKWSQIPLFIGTAVYTFEGISLVLPLQQNMKKKERFTGMFGILNVSMFIITGLVFIIGFMGYWKYGDDVMESLTLNLDIKHLSTKILIICMILAILCSYALQFYIPVILILPSINDSTSPISSQKNREYVLRAFLVLVTFLAAELIPHLDLFISLIGACGGTFLALMLPALAYIAGRKGEEHGLFYWRLLIDILSLALGLVSFASGSFFSILEIVKAFKKDFHF